jgi:hypothetical protein
MVKLIEKNRISEILSSRGSHIFIPNDDLLNTLGMNRTRFQNIIRNRTKLRPLELRAFATWLNVEENELIGKEA